MSCIKRTFLTTFRLLVAVSTNTLYDPTMIAAKSADDKADEADVVEEADGADVVVEALEAEVVNQAGKAEAADEAEVVDGS